MERARMKINLCVLAVVFIAIIMGIFYYYGQSEPPETQSEGTLISNAELYSEQLWA